MSTECPHRRDLVEVRVGGTVFVWHSKTNEVCSWDAHEAPRLRFDSSGMCYLERAGGEIAFLAHFAGGACPIPVVLIWHLIISARFDPQQALRNTHTHAHTHTHTHTRAHTHT